MKNELMQMLHRYKILHAPVLLSLLCMILVALKIYQVEQITYGYLVWNLFLAWIPLFLGLLLKNKSLNLLSAGILIWWLLFLPNAPYLVTDLIHLKDDHNSGNWYEALVLFTFAVTGLVNGLVSLNLVRRFLQGHLSKFWSNLAVFAAIPLAGYGIYLGRVLRWNSWDIVVNPVALLKESLLHLDNFTAQAMTITFSMLLGVSFLILNQFFEYEK